MKRSKFTEQQIAFGLQQAESGTQVAEVCRKGHLGSDVLSHLPLRTQSAARHGRNAVFGRLARRLLDGFDDRWRGIGIGRRKAVRHRFGTLVRPATRQDYRRAQSPRSAYPSG
jgi:hypothetical protein